MLSFKIKPQCNTIALTPRLTVILGRRLEDMPKDWATKYLHTQHEWVQLLDPSTTPPVDMFPFLKWFPASFAPWKRRAERVRKDLFKAYSELVDHAHQSEHDDNNTNDLEFESLIGRLLRESHVSSGRKGPSLSKRDIIFIAGGVLDGAFDTAYYTSLALLKTLAAYPDVQKRIQSELDEAWYMPTIPVMFQKKIIANLLQGVWNGCPGTYRSRKAALSELLRS